MIRLDSSSQIRIASTAQDFRKGIDGFAGLCRNHFNQNPQNGVVYVFINRSKTMVRLLAYEHNGYWLMTQRLSKGKFLAWPQSQHAMTTVMAKQLRQLLRNDVTEASFFNHEAKDEHNA